MDLRFRQLGVTVRLLVSVVLLAEGSAHAQVKAFPSAEGFGANAKGGRGGRVIKVTNLNDSGPGSFRDAVTAKGPRTVIFNVSGTIQLKSNVRIIEPYITIAGQTSPGAVQFRTTPGVATGITFYKPAHDIVVRHLRVRMGGPAPNDSGEPLLAWSVHDAIFDHISLQWGTDSQFMAYGTFNNITLQWSLIAEGAAGIQPDGTASGKKGIHIGGWGDPLNGMRYSDHHNVFESNGSRNPLMQRAGIFDFRNNLIYNYGGGGSFGAYSLNHSAHGNLVNNRYIPGPSSHNLGQTLVLDNGGPVRVRPGGGMAERGGTKVYTSGNWGPKCPSGCPDDWVGFVTTDYYAIDKSIRAADAAMFRTLTPFPAPAVATIPTSQVKDTLLPVVGASKPSRDSVDSRIASEVKDGTQGCFTGTCIGSGGPWPTLSGPAPLPDSDEDGIPNAWETAHQLNPNDPLDGPKISANGYTHLENYLNQLAGDDVPNLGGGDKLAPSTPSALSVH